MKCRPVAFVVLLGLVASCEGPAVEGSVPPEEARRRLDAELARSKAREVARAKRLFAELSARRDVEVDEEYIAENPWLTDPKDAREAADAVQLLQWVEANRQFVSEREWYWSEGLVTVKNGALFEMSGSTRVFRLSGDGFVEVADSPDGTFAPYGSFRVLVRSPFTVVVSPTRRPGSVLRLHVSRPSIAMNWIVEVDAPDLPAMGRTDVALAPSYTERQIVEMVTRFLSTEPTPSVESVRAYERELRETWRRDFAKASPRERSYIAGPYVEGVVYTQWLSVRLPSGVLRAR